MPNGNKKWNQLFLFLATQKHNEKLKSKQTTNFRPRPSVQRSATLRENLCEPVRKFFLPKARSATTDGNFEISETVSSGHAEAQGGPSGEQPKRESKSERLPATKEENEHNC